MPDIHPEIDKNRPGKRFVLNYLPEWDWYNTESAARTVADKAQEVIDEFVKALRVVYGDAEFQALGIWTRGTVISTLLENKEGPKGSFKSLD